MMGDSYFSHVLFIGSKPLKKYILRWFDHWLKGIDTGIMEEPEVTIHDSGTQKWRYETEYPVKRTKWTKFYLRSIPEGAPDMPVNGIISPEAPSGDETPDTYLYANFTQVAKVDPPGVVFVTAPLGNDQLQKKQCEMQQHVRQ